MPSPSATTAHASSRTTSRSRKEPVRFDPGADVAAEAKAAAARAVNGADGRGKPISTTMTTKKRPSASKKATATSKKRKSAATATTAVAKKKSAPWTAAEDQRLRLLVEQEQQRQQQQQQQQQQADHQQEGRGGIRWIHLAKAHGKSRTSKQLRERWLNVLDPTLKRGDWTEEETALVIRLQKEMGNK